MKLWGSRLGKSTDDHVQRLNASLPFDIRLFAEDIEVSLVWAQGLVSAGVLSDGECRQIENALKQIRGEFETGSYRPSPGDEDIHTAVERRLVELIGPLGGKLHTGRSRNDQVATDFRLWVMRACRRVSDELDGLLQAVLESAEANLQLPMPGYTHLQPAQPVTWGHWALWHFWALARGRERFQRASSAAGVLPLGAGALAGTAVAVDRRGLASALGFGEISLNSLDAVADRDFALEFLFACAALGVHLSRMAEQVIIFSSAEFGFVELDDAFATGSSLMPQKKNPDPLELARGKTGRLIGHLAGLMATLKGLPSAYDKDLQEDKEPVFDAHDTLMLLLPALKGLVASLRVHPERMAARLDPGMLAVELADYLVGKGLAFRQAHDLVGKIVRLAEERGLAITDLTAPDLQEFSPLFESDAGQVLEVRAALARREIPGGVGPAALQAQLEAARRKLLAGKRAD
jgi:argininosuccinate lyase